ncbi:Ig domain-containing protein [Sphingobacterium mizutaii]|uniref:Ig-like domain-containing protein n=1 Tax=Sphingobacterium mizutaii TaxID=1010 RepID=UPI00162A8405|nr:Ig-like domain-containing protein [Sphingobacterium mizutaii]
MNILKFTGKFIGVLAFAFIISACSKSEGIDPEPEKPKYTKIEISSFPEQLFVAENFDLLYNFSPETLTQPEVIWKSSKPEVIDVVNGRISALKTGESNISVQIVGTNIVSTKTIKVVERPIVVNEIVLEVSKTKLNVGDKILINHKLLPQNSIDINKHVVEWSSSDESVATILNGNLTAVGRGFVKITAKVKDTDISASVQFEILPEIKYAEIGKDIIAPDGLTLQIVSVDYSTTQQGTKSATIVYLMTNNTSNLKVIEGGFKLYMKSGNALSQYGFFNYIYPGESSMRSYTFKEVGTEVFDYFEYRPSDFTKQYDSFLRLVVK